MGKKNKSIIISIAIGFILAPVGMEIIYHKLNLFSFNISENFPLILTEIFSGLLGFGAVIWTIYENNKIINEERKLEYKPLLSHQNIDVSDVENENIQFIKFYNNNDGNLCIIKSRFQKQKIKQSIDKKDIAYQGKTVFFKIKNIGSGPAVNIFITMEKVIYTEKNDEEYSFDVNGLNSFYASNRHDKFKFYVKLDDGFEYSKFDRFILCAPFSLGINEEIIFEIIFENEMNEKYMIIFEYSDTFKTTYQQKILYGKIYDDIGFSPISPSKEIDKE